MWSENGEMGAVTTTTAAPEKTAPPAPARCYPTPPTPADLACRARDDFHAAVSAVLIWIITAAAVGFVAVCGVYSAWSMLWGGLEAWKVIKEMPP